MFQLLIHTIFLSSISLSHAALTLAPALTTNDAPVSNPLAATFVGFGIEPSNLFSYTGREETNNFSIRLLEHFKKYSGGLPHIRLGGNTQDYMIYDEDHDKYYWELNSQYESNDCIKIGPKFFEALDRLPNGTPISFGLNMAISSQENAEEATTMAEKALQCENVDIRSFELGNEVDLYAGSAHMRTTSPWHGKVYTDLFLSLADTIYERVLEPNGIGPTFFEPPATANTQGNDFGIDSLVGYGISRMYNGRKFVKSWNQHDYYYFFGVSPGEITLEKLMDLDQTNKQFTWWAKEVGVAQRTGIPYALREMCSVGPIGQAGVSDTLGAALWTLNFFLFAADLDIASVEMHMTENSFASAWQPTEFRDPETQNLLEQKVRPQYYAHFAMAQIIGNGNGTTQIGVLNTDGAGSTYKSHIRAYASYALGNLQAVILINTKVAEASITTKAAFPFDLDLKPENGNKVMYLSYLTGPGADSTEGVTFNNIKFSDVDGEMNKTNSQDIVAQTDSEGHVQIDLRDSEAVVVNIGALLGSNPVAPGTPEGFKPAPKHKKGAGSKSNSGATTAAWVGAATSVLSLAATGSWRNTQCDEESGLLEEKFDPGTLTDNMFHPREHEFVRKLEEWVLIIGLFAFAVGVYMFFFL